MDKSKKRKRTKVEYLTCGDVFDNDFKTKHEIKHHAGKNILVKHFGAPENPFTAAAKQKNAQIQIDTDIVSFSSTNYFFYFQSNSGVA